MARLMVNGTEVRVVRVGGSPSGAKWVGGWVGDIRFEALVFAEHADNPEWEIGASRISKLWLRSKKNVTIYNWDRGLDDAVPPADAKTQAVVDLLCGFLADRLWGKVGAA